MSTGASTSRRRFVAAIGALAAARVTHAQDPNGTIVQNAARAWLAYADALDGNAGYDRAGAKFRDAMARDAWIGALKKERDMRGNVVQRSVKSTQFRRQIQGQADGDYALVVFATAFVNRPQSEESITLERESDGAWRVVGYLIR